ncbi:hypothetical protein FAGAP_12842 [Fusarium agapanthi]|uniref:Uncharacterized protein n=1 Tax=Fusarium agapanthi TaxID=1803897 RepID=A0A9P5E2L6_9HYPO|nr:hypothetical protein FAGAP_12842 [Fusarium agapanthi]
MAQRASLRIKSLGATTTVMNQITVIKKVIRKVTVVVVPKAKTTTETETIIQVTTTYADPDVETATETENDIQTTNLYTTSTIAAPSGFIPIKQFQGYIRIDCTKKIPSNTTKTITTTVKGARITIKPKTITKKTTSIFVITVTEYGPLVTETETETETETFTALRVNLAQRTQTQTIPERLVITVESIVPADPFYAACSSNNLASTANGGKRIADSNAWTENWPISISGLTSAYA